MLRVKGCFNENCSACRNDIKYLESYRHCPKCGNELGYVCLKCHTQLDPDSNESYCVTHAAQREETMEKFKSFSAVALTELSKAGSLALKQGKNFLDNINNKK